MTPRQKAIEQGLTYYIGKSCKEGHEPIRYTSTRQCVQCVKASTKMVSKEIKGLWDREYKLKSKKRLNELSRKRYSANKLKLRDRCSKWAKENKEKVNEKNRRYRKANPDRVASISSRKRADKLSRIPKWADLLKIREIYKECKQISIKTGITHHVDHIIPLKGNKVSGLHVENNLRIIPAIDNIKKSAKLIEELL